MRDKQIWVKNPAVQVDSRARRYSAAGAFLGVEGREPKLEIKIKCSNLMVWHTEIAQALPGEQFKAIIPDQ